MLKISAYFDISPGWAQQKAPCGGRGLLQMKKENGQANILTDYKI